jgi:hypothetical protein
VEADQKFFKIPKIGLRMHTLQMFDLLLQLTERTNLDDSNTNIFILHQVSSTTKLFGSNHSKMGLPYANGELAKTHLKLTAKNNLVH